MASTPSPPHAHAHAHASSDSLASATSSSTKESRFNRLIHRLHGSNSSRDLSNDLGILSLSSPSTPLKYDSGNVNIIHSNASPALSDIDDIPLERPVFESRFMRELQEGGSSGTSAAAGMISSSTSTSYSSPSSRPPLAISYSSPAAVIGHHHHSKTTTTTSPNTQSGNGIQQQQQHHGRSNTAYIPSARELERTRSSPAASSSSSSSSPSSSNSLKSRLVRVASSSSLFAAKPGASSNSTSSGNIANKENDGIGTPTSNNNILQHRKTASLVSGPSPSPRSRLAASLAATSTGRSHTSPGTILTSPTSLSFAKSHAYRHSEDVRQYPSRISPSNPSSSSTLESTTTNKPHASSPPFPGSSPSPSTSTLLARAPSPNIHALREQDEGGLSNINHINKSKESLFSGLSVSGFSLSRKKSMDGLSLASNASTHHLPIPEDDYDDEEQGVRLESGKTQVATTSISEDAQHPGEEDEELTRKRNSASSDKHAHLVVAPATATAQARPALGEHRYLSSDRVATSQDPASNATTQKATSTTPGFPRHVPNASYSGSSTTTNSGGTTVENGQVLSNTTTLNGTNTIQGQRTGLISSGLSESSRRFRSAFRLNKNRAAATTATPGQGSSDATAAASLMGAGTGTGTTRRAMRVPLRQQQLVDDEEEMDQSHQVHAKQTSEEGASTTIGNSSRSPKSPDLAANGSATRDTHSPPMLDSSSSASSRAAPTPPKDSVMGSGHMPSASSSSTLGVRAPSPREKQQSTNDTAGDEIGSGSSKDYLRDTAEERAQLVPSGSTATTATTVAAAAAASRAAGHGHTASRPVNIHHHHHALSSSTSANALRPGRVPLKENSDTVNASADGHKMEANVNEDEDADADYHSEIGRSSHMSPPICSSASMQQLQERRGQVHAYSSTNTNTNTNGRPPSRNRFDDALLVPDENDAVAAAAGTIPARRPTSRQALLVRPDGSPTLTSDQQSSNSQAQSYAQAHAHQRSTSENTLVGYVHQLNPHSHPQVHHERLASRDLSQSQHKDREVPLQDQEEVLAIENDKENVGAADWYRQRHHGNIHGLSGSEKAGQDKQSLQQQRQHQAEPLKNRLAPLQQQNVSRRPLQEQQPNHQGQHFAHPYLPEPRQQGPLPQQHRMNKISSSSSNGGLGYFPSDRQVVVNDYAVPTKRSGDTPPSSSSATANNVHEAASAQHQPFPSQSSVSNSAYPSAQSARPAPPPTRPPNASLPALPSLGQSQQHQGQDNVQHPSASAPAAPVVKRPAGTVAVQGKIYTRMGLLGRGGSSKVFRVCDKDHLVYALKKIDLGRGADNETYQAFLNEISLLEALRGHDRIIQLVAHEVNEAKRSLIMVMEIGEIDLNALLQERIARGLPASMNFVRYMWEQMLEAVNVIHDEGIVHTDLKPANFVLVKGALKLIDFGIAKAIPNDTTNIARDQQIGTANYMSPEALNPHNSAKNGRVMKLGRPSDVWSLGCILYQMVYGHTPFGQIKNLAAKMNAIQTPGYAINFPTHAVPTTIKGEPLPDLAVRVEDDLLAVMKSCLRYESKRRATIPELLMDPFLRKEGSTRDIDADASRVPQCSEQHLNHDLVNAIVKQTLNWSNGRQPSRGEQERFVEAILRQANGMIR